MKKCNKCKVEKELTEFGKMKASKDGLRSECKSCRNERAKEYREKNREYLKEYAKEWHKKNKERKKEYYQQNKERFKERRKKYYQGNKERLNEYKKEWYQKNKERIKEKGKKYRERNKELIKERKKKYREQNRGLINERARERFKTDSLYKMSTNLRSRTYKAFKRKCYSKNSKTQKMLGVDWEVAKQHIEKQFKKGMNWDNYGEWHIDHIIPLASANTEEELKKLCHYSNLQPLWAEDNLSKSDSIEGQQIKFRI
jgi:hypothetical protein